MKILESGIVFLIITIVVFVNGVGAEWNTPNHVGPKFNPTLAQAKLQLMHPMSFGIQPVVFDSLPILADQPSGDRASGYKNRKSAFFRSLILPGAGEYYVGKRTFAQIFLAAEVTLWVSHFAFLQYGKWVRKDALAFAATHSGATIKGKPSQFFVDIGNYSDIYSYNEAKLRFGEYEKLYSETEYFWSWDSDDHRQKFQDMRIASDRARNRATYVLGAIFANHLISAINATWQAVHHNKKLNQRADGPVLIQFLAEKDAGRIFVQIKKEF